MDNEKLRMIGSESIKKQEAWKGGESLLPLPAFLVYYKIRGGFVFCVPKPAVQ